MFTGIIKHHGKIIDRKNSTFTIEHNFDEPLWVGESIAINGMCGTVTDFENNWFTTDIMEESRNKTIFGTAEVGTELNLEKSAKIGDRNSGHNVSGHVDEIGKILLVDQKSDFTLIRIEFSENFFPLVIKKGSIALDGISLTVSNLSSVQKKPWLEVSIIPHTWAHTNLKNYVVGMAVNLEFDQLGKYIVRFLEAKKGSL